MSLVENLNKKLTEKFSKSIADFNKNVYVSARLDNGNYECPVVGITTGGTALEAKLEKLPAPAVVSVVQKQTTPVNAVYRLAIPVSEAEIADTNPKYFDYFFTKVLRQALANYAGTTGGPEELRFGSEYVKVEMKEFGAPDAGVVDISGNVCLELSGSWSSGEEVKA